MVERPIHSWSLDLVLVLLTGGLWIIVWPLILRQRCVVCMTCRVVIRPRRIRGLLPLAVELPVLALWFGVSLFCAIISLAAERLGSSRWSESPLGNRLTTRTGNFIGSA